MSRLRSRAVSITGMHAAPRTFARSHAKRFEPKWMLSSVQENVYMCRYQDVFKSEPQRSKSARARE